MHAQTDQEDKALMKKVASGDTSALDKLYQKHWRTIDAFVRGKLSGVSDIDASDIVQDVFQKVQQKARLYKPTGRVLSWMFKIAQNTLYDLIRKGASTLRRDTNYALERPPLGGEVEGPSPPMWEYGDSAKAPGGICGQDVPIDDDCDELYSAVAPGGYVILPRSSGGDIWVWQSHVPQRRVKRPKRDRLRNWMRGGGRDDIRGMFGCLGLAPQENKKSCH